MSISYEEFLSMTEESTVVDFWAEWCQPCKIFAPAFNEVSEMYPKINFIKINIDENQELCSMLGIMSIPTVHFYENSMLSSEMIGGVSKEQLMQFIAENIN